MITSLIRSLRQWLAADTKPQPISDPNWGQTRAFNMRVIERRFMDGEDIRPACDWSIRCGQVLGDELYLQWATLMKEGCQKLIDDGRLESGARAQNKPLVPGEIKMIREAYR